MGEFDFGKKAVLMAADATMRDDFAKAAMPAIYAELMRQLHVHREILSTDSPSTLVASRMAYEMADAMLKARQ